MTLKLCTTVTDFFFLTPFTDVLQDSSVKGPISHSPLFSITEFEAHQSMAPVEKDKIQFYVYTSLSCNALF